MVGIGGGTSNIRRSPYFRESAMDYDAWEQAVPTDIQQDPIWALRIYRTALYLGDLARRDVRLLATRPELGELPAQLLRAAQSLSVNIAEGHSRLSRRDRGRFYEYALGSAREARDWYYKAREEMGSEEGDHRIHSLTIAIKVLTVLANQCRPARADESESD
jgi:four helix bundle protein